MSDSSLVALFAFIGAIVAALINGVVTSLVQANQSIRKTEYDLYFIERNKAYQRFASSLNLLTDSFIENDENYVAFMDVYYSAFLLASDDTKSAMEELYLYLSKERYFYAPKLSYFLVVAPYYKKICECMRKELISVHSDRKFSKITQVLEILSTVGRKK